MRKWQNTRRTDSVYKEQNLLVNNKKKNPKTLTSLEKELIHKLAMLAISQAVLSNLLHPDLFGIQEPPFLFSPNTTLALT